MKDFVVVIVVFDLYIKLGKRGLFYLFFFNKNF